MWFAVFISCLKLLFCFASDIISLTNGAMVLLTLLLLLLLPCCARAYFTNDRLLLMWPLNSMEDSRSSETMIAMAAYRDTPFL